MCLHELSTFCVPQFSQQVSDVLGGRASAGSGWVGDRNSDVYLVKKPQPGIVPTDPQYPTIMSGAAFRRHVTVEADGVADGYIYVAVVHELVDGVPRNTSYVTSWRKSAREDDDAVRVRWGLVESQC